MFHVSAGTHGVVGSCQLMAAFAATHSSTLPTHDTSRHSVAYVADIFMDASNVSYILEPRNTSARVPCIHGGGTRWSYCRFS